MSVEILFTITTTLVTCVSIYLVWRAHRESSSIAKEQVRASLSVDGAFLFIRDGHLLLCLKVKNCGNTIAKDVRNQISWTMVDGPRFGSPADLKFPEVPASAPVEIGSGNSVDLNITVPITNDEIRLMLDGLLFIYFNGTVSYKDTFGVAHETSVRTTTSGLQPTIGGWSLAAHNHDHITLYR